MKGYKLLHCVVEAAFVLSLAAGCGSPAHAPVSPPATSMPASNPATSVTQASTQAPAPGGATSHTAVTYGYADAVPLAMVAPVDGLKISLHDITYTTVQDIWVLGEYRLSITSPAGAVDEIHFLGFEYDDNLSPLGYSVLENGQSLSGPSRKDFDAGSLENGIGLYPSGYEIGLLSKLPCPGTASNDEYAKEQFFDIWVDVLAKRTVVCESGETYTLSLDAYDCMDQPSLKHPASL